MRVVRVVRVGGCEGWKQLLAFSLSSIFIKMLLRVERLWKGLPNPWSFALFTIKTSHNGVLVFSDRC